MFYLFVLSLSPFANGPVGLGLYGPGSVCLGHCINTNTPIHAWILVNAKSMFAERVIECKTQTKKEVKGKVMGGTGERKAGS